MKTPMAIPEDTLYPNAHVESNCAAEVEREEREHSRFENRVGNGRGGHTIHDDDKTKLEISVCAQSVGHFAPLFRLVGCKSCSSPPPDDGNFQ